MSPCRKTIKQMNKIRCAIFDFDGTVADTKYSVMDSARHALKHFGIDESEEALRRFIGPTLWYSFSTYYGIKDKDCDEAVRIYREYYAAEGIKKARLYDGIEDAVNGLKALGIETAVATVREENSLLQNFSVLGINGLFDAYAGSLENGERSDKAELIAVALERLHVPEAVDAVVIGDSRTDCEGANAIGCGFIAALYDRDISEFEGLDIGMKAYAPLDLVSIISGLI